jgi:3-dehydroquinate synthetase
MVEAGLDRTSAVVALGGGVVGDLAGFAAASLYRGIPCVQVPTTLVAMVDSAIGGKTGINLDAGKNLVGAFHQPRLVLADSDLLATLPVRERRAAFGEILKYALLDGEALYAEAEALAPALAAEVWSADAAPVIRRSAAIKAAIVSADEREQGGERALLNLGHTVGHAIEAAAGYGTLLHGEAVALGLLAACRVSAGLGLGDRSLEDRVAATLTRAGLATDIDRWLRPEVLARAFVDKKRTGSRIKFIAIEAPGRPSIVSLELARLGEILAAPGPL